MRILITNDDGILAHGLKVLEKIARHFTDDVWIVAPEVDQSGASHSLTLRKPLRIRDISEKKFAVSGTPTDCVMAAVSHIIKDKRPDVVLSGVNNGGNVAEDVTYSGTIAAAIEGSMLGIPSIALSQVNQKESPTKWSTAEHFAPIVLEKVLKESFDPSVIININFPDALVSSVQGVRVVNQGHRKIEENLVECTDPRGRKYYWIGPGNYRYQDNKEKAVKDTDIEAIINGYVAITPLSLNLTHYASMDLLRSRF